MENITELDLWEVEQIFNNRPNVEVLWIEEPKGVFKILIKNTKQSLQK